MKVILLKDVPKVGKKYESKEVTPGFARNFLFPKKLAEVATTKSVARLQLARSLHEEKIKIEEARLMKELEKMENAVLTLKGKANDKGHLFAAIHIEEILPLVEKELGLQLEEGNIVLEKPIKELGEHIVFIRVQDKDTSIKIVVEDDK